MNTKEPGSIPVVEAEGELRRAAMLAVQRALVGLITPDMRGVFVTWELPETIRLRFFVDTEEVAEATWEAANYAHTYVLADFPEGDVTWSIEPRPHGTEWEVDPSGAWAFLRAEPG